MTVTNCEIIGAGGVYGVRNFGTANVVGCTISDHLYEGVYNLNGVASVTNSTLFGNNAGVGNTGTLTMDNCTVVGNTTVGIYTWPSDGIEVINNSLVVGNTGGNAQAYNGSDFTFNNCITMGTTTEAGLDPDGLKDNGGPTRTIALLPGGTAIDAGNNALVPGGVAFDQRGTGHARIAGTSVDIGAYEYAAPSPTSPVAPTDQLSSAYVKLNRVFLNFKVGLKPAVAVDIANYQVVRAGQAIAVESVKRATTSSVAVALPKDSLKSGDVLTVSYQLQDSQGRTVSGATNVRVP